MEEAAKVVADAAAETAPEGLRGLSEPVVIEPDEGESESHDKGAYAAFKEAIEVEDYEASYLEALRFRVNLVRFFFLTFPLPSAKTYYL